ncbi:type I restriction enzyme endonuclease domain-containing protein [Candidatus Stoquefichus sp. SB1]|uniref:type I restriction enzyme endonuclease domain-containing protein n=1 Tax=Candidatus Stoquefichus sp. SB1 TaxID=1658109 RepID=UPI00067ED574|nr:type I restriction enzyme endonuclease domain-containing protein [Candidatus Stoquefichus sp. SB1]
MSERDKDIIDRYNAGGIENKDYYKQLIQLMEELKQESERFVFKVLTEELELYDLLIRGKKINIKKEQQVKLAAKHLYTTIINKRLKLLVVDCYKDEQPKVRHTIEVALNDDLARCYGKESFNAKIDLLLNYFIDMGIQRYGWIKYA